MSAYIYMKHWMTEAFKNAASPDHRTMLELHALRQFTPRDRVTFKGYYRQ